MTVFQSVGSNYTARDVWRHVKAVGGSKQQRLLCDKLTEQYDGQNSWLFHTGRAALAESLRSITGGRGAVVVNAFTCSVVVDAVRAAGCQVVYADIEVDRLHYSAATLRRILSSRDDVVVAIIQNSLGIPVKINQFENLAKEFSIDLIEDVAHAVGGFYEDGRLIGTVGSATVLSFGRDKMLDTVNGGALVMRTDAKFAVTAPAKLPSWLTRLRDRFYPLIASMARGLFRVRLGGVWLRLVYGLRLAVRSADGAVDSQQTMPGWQAKLARRQIESLSEAVENRRAGASQYQDLSEFHPFAKSSSAVRVPLMVANRQSVLAALKQAKFFFEDIWYDVPVAPARLYDRQNFPEAENPRSTEVSAHIINLPTHNLVSEKQISKMIAIIKEVAEPWK